MITASEAIVRLHSLLEGMLSKPEYNFPIVAAQFQYRERYYGLSSAAMLEDLFFDAMSNYISTTSPGTVFSRPPRGEKGWDYSIDGEKISHKVSKAGPIEIAALWDATRTDIETWTFGFPVSFTNGGYSPKVLKGKISNSDFEYSFKPLTKDCTASPGDKVLLVSWPSNEVAEIIHIWDVPASGPVLDWLGFRLIWLPLTKKLGLGIAANHIEIFVVKSESKSDEIEIGRKLLFNSCHRPGTFLFDTPALKNLPVKRNNRAVLIDRKIVENLMINAYEQGLFVPMPTWFAAFAGERPPDLYLAQKNEYDQMFSRYK